MSTTTVWLSDASSNKLKQSYFRNFVDVSGHLILRNNEDIKLFDRNNNYTTFSVNSKEFKVFQSQNSSVDISTNKLVFIHDLSTNVQAKFDEYDYTLQYVDTSTNVMAFNADMSMNQGLEVARDVSLNNLLYVAKKISIGKSAPRVTIDISANDAIKLPTGSISQRPDTSGSEDYNGYMRYNNEINVFEVFSNGYWISIGNGLSDQDQDTYILAETTPGADNDELLFVTTNNERMRILSSGDVSMNHGLIVANDVSLNSNLHVDKSANISSTLEVDGDVSMNSKLSVSSDVSLNNNVFVGNNISINANLSIVGEMVQC